MKKKVMLIDDSSVIRKVARRILESLDFDVVEAMDCAGALADTENSMPDAIFLDSGIGGADALSFIRELRRRPGGLNPKVIYCMIERDESRIAMAMRAGADEIMMKPFDPTTLQLALESINAQ